MSLLATLNFALSTAQEIGTTTDARKQGRAQMGFYKDSLSSLRQAEQSLNQSLESSLQLPTLEARRSSEKLSESGQRALEQSRKSQQQISEASGFAGQSMDMDRMKDIRKGFTTKVEDLDISLGKSLADVLSNFEQQRFEMQSQRQQLEMQKRLAEQQANKKYFGIFG
tara:strand:+ start:607 stop:1110 length:504 start_codon:yes stop_codon:yes gene_type:complete